MTVRVDEAKDTRRQDGVLAGVGIHRFIGLKELPQPVGSGEIDRLPAER